MSKLINFYERVLKVAGLVVDSNDAVSAQVQDITAPIMVGEKRLVLPTPRNLAVVKDGNIEVFHPLNESIRREESAVLTVYRRCLNVRLNYVLMSLCSELLTLATSPKRHERSKPEHLELMRLLGDATPKTLEKFEHVAKLVKAGTTKCAVNLYIKRGGKAEGVNCYRAAVVTFPLFEELKKGSGDVWGVSLSKKDFGVLKNLFEYILPGLGEDEHYTRGSLSNSWPTLESLLKTMLVLASSINSAIYSFQDVIDSLDELAFPEAWMDDAKNLAQYQSDSLMVPQIGGNVGQPVGQAAPTPAPNTLVMPNPNAVQPAQSSLPQRLEQNVPLAVAARMPDQALPRTAAGGLDFGAIAAQRAAVSGWQQPSNNLPPSRQPQPQGGFGFGFNQQQQPGGFGQPNGFGQPGGFGGVGRI